MAKTKSSSPKAGNKKTAAPAKVSKAKKTKKSGEKKVVSVSGKKPKKPIGKITHYFNHLGVAIIKFNKPAKVGDTVRFMGPHTDFTQKISSIQYNHKDMKTAAKGKEVGVKVKEKVHDSDSVYEP